MLCYVHVVEVSATEDAAEADNARSLPSVLIGYFWTRVCQESGSRLSIVVRREGYWLGAMLTAEHVTF
jgi:hypothetical protein